MNRWSFPLIAIQVQLLVNSIVYMYYVIIQMKKKKQKMVKKNNLILFINNDLYSTLKLCLHS